MSEPFVVVSVGEWHGRSGRCIADNLPEGGIMYAVDTWNGSSGEPEQHFTAKEREGDHAHEWWWCNLHEHILAGRVIPVRMHSANAAQTLHSLGVKVDMIFLDADHSHQGVRDDILAWAPLMKDGALWCGHDYYTVGEEPFAWIGVRETVQELFPDVKKTAVSLWYSRSKPLINTHQAELDVQIAAQCDDPEYAKVVESSQREIARKLFDKVDKSARILDVGCGSGVTIGILAEMGFTRVNGIDLIDSLLGVKGDMHDLPHPDGYYDVIYCSHALEHAYDPLKALAEFKRVLKPDGQLFLVLPYPDVIDSEHRARVHCGSEKLGSLVHDGGTTLRQTIEDVGFDCTYFEHGNLRGEPEIYLQFSHATQPKGRVIDTFIFNDELDVLDIRLATLNDSVDRFVLVEGTLTHSGKPKPLHFDINKERFAAYLPKITHVIVDDYPEPSGDVYDQAWTRERHQRDSIMHGLQDCEPDDIILVGDADEIASPEAIRNYDVSLGLCRLKQRLFYYYLNCENKQGWDWQKIVPYSIVKALTPCGVRYPPAGHTPLLENGGRHFSFLGDAANAIKKVGDYAHREFDTPELMDTERVSRLISEGQDIFGRDCQYEFGWIDDDYPQYVHEHIAGLLAKGLIKFATVPLEIKDGVVQLPVVAVSENATFSIGSVEQVPSIEISSPTDDFIFTSEQIDARMRAQVRPTVTAEVSTKDRYMTTLPMCLTSIITQTHKPDKLVIYDDGEQADLREMSPFKGLLAMCDERGIKWEIFATPRKGQVTNHQHALDTATTDFIWRVDDDEVAMPDCLERLLGHMVDGVGAVAGLVFHPGNVSTLPDWVDGTLTDVIAGVNLQWFQFNGGEREVDHLYSTFLYRVDAAKKAGGYPKNLSVVGHREETIFSHNIKRVGFKLIVTPHAKTYHLREGTGGIRSFVNDDTLWQQDEKVFDSYLQEWGALSGKPTKLIVADMGRGDHYLLLSILPQLKERHADKELILALCFPEIFEGQDVKIISIADAKVMLGERYEDALLYKNLWERDWTQSIVEGMREFWG